MGSSGHRAHARDPYRHISYNLGSEEDGYESEPCECTLQHDSEGGEGGDGEGEEEDALDPEVGNDVVGLCTLNQVDP